MVRNPISVRFDLNRSTDSSWKHEGYQIGMKSKFYFSTI